MTLTKPTPRRIATTRSLIESLIEMPDVERRIQALPPQTFAALVRKIGVEDAGPLVTLATTQQLVQAFDEDLFASGRAGQRETLDPERFARWLEVLLEAGDDVAAMRFAELDEDFVAHALSSILLVLDEEALRQRLDESEEDESRKVDKALESALVEELDGYMLIARQHDGWDAALALVLALDRDHRTLLVRVLDRMAAVTSSTLDDLDELSTLLTEAESLAEDVEAAREERRAAQGYVEPRAARAFLALTQKLPSADERSGSHRDPLTRAYFRELERNRHVASRRLPDDAALPALPPSVRQILLAADELVSPRTGSELRVGTDSVIETFREALRELAESAPTSFSERMEEFAYLTNVLVAGHERDGQRMKSRSAADAVLATVCLGAVLELRARDATRTSAESKRWQRPTRGELAQVLRERSADFLFRLASSALATGAVQQAPAVKGNSIIYSFDELESALR